MASLNLKLNPSGGRYSEKDNFSERQLASLLTQYLEPSSKTSLEDAANSILALYPPNKAYSKYTFALADFCIELAEQIPYNHPSQLKLARLLKHLARSPKVLEKTPTKTGEDLYHPFQALGERFRDWYTGPESEETGMAWVNYHAFLAHLEATGMWQYANFYYAMAEMRFAFESEPEDEWETRYRVMAAAQWILWVGQEFFKEFLFPLSPETESAWVFGSLYTKGGSTLSLDRWYFWMEGFAAMEKKQCGKECKEIAAKAFNLMYAMAKNMT